MAVDRHCSKAEDGFHTWDLDLDLHKVVCSL